MASTTDTGAPGPAFGANASFTDVINNALMSATSAYNAYQAHANTPPPANTINAIGSSIVTPVALIIGIVVLIWALS
jgi:hypothetical protein